MSLPQPPNLTPEQRQAQMDALRALYGERASFKPSPEDEERARAEAELKRKAKGRAP
jgi:hypothetical protein